jgi:hypothetical protein
MVTFQWHRPTLISELVFDVSAVGQISVKSVKEFLRLNMQTGKYPYQGVHFYVLHATNTQQLFAFSCILLNDGQSERQRM